jgi:hypothetical protein
VLCQRRRFTGGCLGLLCGVDQRRPEPIVYSEQTKTQCDEHRDSNVLRSPQHKKVIKLPDKPQLENRSSACTMLPFSRCFEQPASGGLVAVSCQLDRQAVTSDSLCDFRRTCGRMSGIAQACSNLVGFMYCGFNVTDRSYSTALSCTAPTTLRNAAGLRHQSLLGGYLSSCHDVPLWFRLRTLRGSARLTDSFLNPSRVPRYRASIAIRPKLAWLL